VSNHESLVALRARVSAAVVESLERSSNLGFLGRMPVAEQIDHALGFVVAAETALGRPPSSVADLGTGGGVPGLVLHPCWPECRVVLLDGNQRRIAFLTAQINSWGSSTRVEVVRGRAEELAREDRFRRQFEVVTARSFGSPAVTVECGAPLLGVGGVMVVSEPPGPADERRWPEEGLAQVGLSRASRVRLDDRFGYQVLVKTVATPDRYPRRVGIPSKRPLF
jgi:16S rRNA (guanine527-N7)-methyltransferase